MNDWTQQEIANALYIECEAAKKRISRTRKRLQTQLAQWQLTDTQ